MEWVGDMDNYQCLYCSKNELNFTIENNNIHF